jgi:hypothetical protein
MVPATRLEGLYFAFGRDQPDAARRFDLSDVVKRLALEFRGKARSGSWRDRKEQLIVFTPVQRQLERIDNLGQRRAGDLQSRDSRAHVACGA